MAKKKPKKVEKLPDGAKFTIYMDQCGYQFDYDIDHDGKNYSGHRLRDYDYPDIWKLANKILAAVHESGRTDKISKGFGIEKP